MTPRWFSPISSKLPVGLALCLIAGMAGCAGEGEGPQLTLGALDSVTIRQAIDPDERLVLEEELRLGGSRAPPTEQFHLVSDVAVSDDGGLFVMDRGNHRVLHFDVDGQFVRQIGSPGQGPGEFETARNLTYRRDTLIVSEDGNRIHVFLSDGTLVSTRRLRAPDRSLQLYRVEGTESGWLVHGGRYFGEERSESKSIPTHRLVVHSFSPLEGSAREVGFEWAQVDEGQWVNDFFWVRPPFAHVPGQAIDGLGRIHLVESGDYVIDTYSQEGVLMRRLVNETERIPVTDVLIEQWKESRGCPTELEGLECSRETDRVALSLPRPDHVPVVSRLYPSPFGHIAIERRDLDATPFDVGGIRIWEFFNPDGIFMGRLEAELGVLWFDGTHLIARETDELGVESVVRYRMRIPDGTSE